MRILVARPDHIGDMLLTLPTATELKHVWPDSEIAFLVATGSVEIPLHCPDVDEVISVDFPTLSQPRDPHDWHHLDPRAMQALTGRYDLALLPRPDDPWSAPLIAAAGIPVRLGYDLPRTRPFLTRALPLGAPRHVVHLGLDLVAAVTGQPSRYPPPLPRFLPTAEELIEAERALADAAVPSDDRPIVLHPGAGWPLKRWPSTNWAALAAELQRRLGREPLITGSRAERELADGIVRASGGHGRSLAGALSLGGLAHLFRRARVVVAIDSGPLHLAAAVGAPVVGLYGPASPVEFGPLCSPRLGRVVRADLPCSPCGSLDAPPCGARSEPACLRRVTVGGVVSAVLDLLDGQRVDAIPADNGASTGATTEW